MSGKEINQLVCPFCGRHKPFKNGFRLKELHVDPSEWGIISIRSVGPGPGRGHKGEMGEGLRTIERLNIIESLEDPRFSELAGQVRDRLVLIVRSYLANGVLLLDELT